MMYSKLSELADWALEKIQASGLPMQQCWGIAFHDSQKDSLYQNSELFEGVVAAVASSQEVSSRIGAQEAGRVTLQFIYEVIRRRLAGEERGKAIQMTSDALRQELGKVDWQDYGVANLLNFKAVEETIDLGDSVVIEKRNSKRLIEKGACKEGAIRGLIQDGRGFGFGEYVIIVCEEQPKRPDNFLMTSGHLIYPRAQRALESLRLIAPGDVSMGKIFVNRASAFDFGDAGILSLGTTMDRGPGSVYNFEESMRDSYTVTREALRHFSASTARRGPGNLELALRSFSSSYDRWAHHHDTRLVDVVTALESILGTDSEISFKLAFRISGILASNDAERVTIFNQVRQFYDTRSKIVHGTERKPKHQEMLNRVDDLRDMLRRLLLGFLKLASSDGHDFTRKFFAEKIDETLLARVQTDQLRAAMGL